MAHEDQTYARLTKSLTPAQVWALALGSIVGWGCFVLPGDMFLPQAGPLATLIAFSLGAVLLGFVAVAYSYMIEYTPVAGGEYAYAFTGFGPTAAFVCGWALVLGYVVIIAINISAMALLVRFLLPGVFEFGELYTIAGWKVYTGEVLLMISVNLLFGIMNYRGVTMAGVAQVILAFCLSGGILALFLGTVSLETASLGNLQPLFAEDRSPLLSIMAIFAISPFLFVGFDTVPQAAEEFSFSPQKSRKLMLLAIFWGAILYALVTFSVSIAMPYPELLAKMSALRAQGHTAWATGEVSRMAFGNLGSVILAFAVLGAVCTGINGFYVATTRLLFSMARGAILPKWFAAVHPRYHTPSNSILFTLAIVMLTPWCGRAVVGWIVDMSAVGTAIAYLFTCMAAYRVVHANGVDVSLKKAVCIIGAVTSILCMVLLLLPASPAFIGFAPRVTLAAWIALGFIFYMNTKRTWSTISHDELKRNILGSSEIPVFYTTEDTQKKP